MLIFDLLNSFRLVTFFANNFPWLSAAGLLVAVGNHELKDGVSVEVSFRGGDEDDSSSSDTETGSDTAEEVPIPGLFDLYCLPFTLML